MRYANVIKLILCMKPSTVLFMFELKHYVENVYSELCQYTHIVNEKFQYFVALLGEDRIIDKCNAVIFCAKFMIKNQI